MSSFVSSPLGAPLEWVSITFISSKDSLWEASVLPYSPNLVLPKSDL